MEKPKRCPIAIWEFEKDAKDKRTIQPENSKCFFPAIVVKQGCPDNLHTPGMFKCPETHTDGGNYIDCDLFSSWWWHKFGANTRIKTNKKRNAIPKPLRHEVFKKNKYACVECGATKEKRMLHVDHIIPVSRGGTDELDNLQTLCDECNLSKKDRIINH